MNWDEYFINIAEAIKKKSKDDSTKIGALIVGEDKQILSAGYNSFPRGINDDIPERQERPEKYYWFEHAERNAIYNAARLGVPLKGSTIYVTTGICCADCARGIINVGIVRVYMKKSSMDFSNPTKWEESGQRSIQMLIEAGVEIIYY